MPSITPSALTRTRHVLDDAGVDAVIAAAEQAAREKGYRVVIVVVDASGRTLALRRTPGAQPASDQVAIDKARTAAIFVRPSREIEEQVSSGRFGALALHGARALIGGIPLTVDGEVVGAIGTSGETTDEDESVSIAGAAAEFTTVEVPALTYAGARLVAEAANGVASARGVPHFLSRDQPIRLPPEPDFGQIAKVPAIGDYAMVARQQPRHERRLHRSSYSRRDGVERAQATARGQALQIGRVRAE